MDKVRCSDCGMLAVRAMNAQFNSNGILFFSPNSEYRDEATVGHELNTASCRYEPICVAGKYDYRKDFEGQNSDEQRKLALRIITEDRECDQFVKWQRGFTPKEHMDIKLRKDADTEQRNYNSKMIEKQIQGNIDSARIQSKATICVGLLAASIAVAQVYVAYVQLYKKDPESIQPIIQNILPEQTPKAQTNGKQGN